MEDRLVSAKSFVQVCDVWSLSVGYVCMILLHQMYICSIILFNTSFNKFRVCILDGVPVFRYFWHLS